MSGVDNRIVTMQFNNRDFEQNARTSLSTLQKLKESMNFGSIVGGTIKGLGAIDGALNKIGLKTPFSPLIRAANAGLGTIGTVLDKIGIKNPFSRSVDGASDLQKAAQTAAGPGGVGMLEGAVTGVSNKFIALSTIAITALSNITNRAINAGTAFAKSFTVAPIMDGLHEYETNLKSIQTIQANTDRPLPEIEKSLQELNRYSDQTIYNFSEMAKNIGTFTAAGVDLQTSTASIKGIANLAALSGSNSQQAATAMYQLSQAIASGKVGLMDWNSVVNAGMGGKKLQNALAQTAVAMGKIDEAQVKGVKSGEQLKIAGQSFRESIMAKPGEESWLTSDILVNTLATMDGRFSEAALAAEKTETGLQKYSKAQIAAKIATARTNLETKNGVKYTDEQFKALQKMSTMAFKSATEVKTLGQVFDVAKETIASGWSASFVNIFGNLEQSKKLFTGMSEGLNDIINRNALARNTVLEAWSSMGGRTMLIDALKNSFEAISKIIGTISFGFRQIFPAKTGEQLVNMTESFLKFTEKLVIGDEAVGKLRWTFKGLFAIVGIVWEVVGHVVDLFQRLAGTALEGSSGILDFTAKIGMWLTAVYKSIKYGRGLYEFFDSVGDVLVQPIKLIQVLASAVGSFFSGINLSGGSGLVDLLGTIGKRLGELLTFGDSFDGFGDGLIGFFSNLGNLVGQALSGIGELIAAALTSDAFGPALDAVNTGLFAALTAMLYKFFKGGASVDITGGLFSNISGILEEATGSLTALQTNLKADALMKIGVAIAVLAGALLVLSTIDAGDLRKALAAMTAGFGVLIGALVALMKFMGPVGIIQIYAVSSAMTKMALSILLLSFALKTLASIKFGEMLRGLVGLGLTMKILSKAMLPLAAGSKGMIKAAASLILVGIALNVLAVALKIFATMSWEEMAKGLTTLLGTLLALSIGLKAMPDLNAEAITLIALSVAINILAVALKVFATMSWVEMSKGILMLAGALGVIGLAMRIMPKGMLLQAVAMNAIAASVVVLAGALKILGGMKWSSIGKGLGALAGALVILAIGLHAMKGTLFGAAALVVASAALAVLVPVLAMLGSLSIGTIVTSLAALAGIFVILGVAGYLLAPVSPVILALGAALLLLGAGLALAGTGALLAATAFGIVVAAGTAGAAVLANILATLIASIPPAMAAFGQGVVAFATAIGEGAPKIAAAFGKILGNLIDQVTKNTPKLGRMFLVMLDTALKVVVTSIPKIANAGLKLIVDFLAAISRHIPRIVDLAADIIVKFLNGIGRNIHRIIQAGVDLILDFVRGVTKAIRDNDEEVGEAGADLGLALVTGMASAVRAGGGKIKDAAMAAAREAWNAVKDFFKIKSPSRLMRDTIGKPIMQGWARGMHDEAPAVSDEIKAVGRTAMDTLATTLSGLNDAFEMDPNLNPTVTPVLDLSLLTKEANKMSSILATAPIMPTVSYQTAAGISTMTQDAPPGPSGPGESGGDTYVTYEQHLHSPEPLDSVKIYRDSKSLLSLKKEELAT